MKTTFSILTGAALLALLPMAALADGPLSANVALTTKYKFRGQDQSDGSRAVLPAIQGGFDYATPSGVYLGNWNSSIGYADGTEMDLYGGWRGAVSGLAVDVGALHYYYPGRSNSLDTTELYGSVGFGPVTAKYSHTVSSKYFGIVDGRNTGYYEINGGIDLATSIKLVAHVGYTRFPGDARNNGGVNYTDFKVGADVDVGSGFTAGIAVVGADKKASYGDINKTRLVVSLSKSL